MKVVAVDRPDVPPLEMPERFKFQIVYFMTPTGEQGAPNLSPGEYWIRADEARKWLEELVVYVVSRLDRRRDLERLDARFDFRRVRGRFLFLLRLGLLLFGRLFLLGLGVGGGLGHLRLLLGRQHAFHLGIALGREGFDLVFKLIQLV